jgi:hypothetical protein
MSKVDWSKAPARAVCYANELFWEQDKDTGKMRFFQSDEISRYHGADMIEISSYKDFETRSLDWPTEQRIDIVGTNGGDGMHYGEQREVQGAQKAKAKSKYHRVIKGAQIDVYDVLKAYGVTCPAIAHAIKKLLLPGERHAKTWEQDINEAIASLERAKELRND